MDIDGDRVKIGKLIEGDKDFGFICIRKSQEYTIKHGFFGKKEKVIHDEIGWISNADKLLTWGVVEPEDATYLKHDQLKLVGKIYSIQWLKSPMAEEVFSNYFNWREPA